MASKVKIEKYSQDFGYGRPTKFYDVVSGSRRITTTTLAEAKKISRKLKKR